MGVGDTNVAGRMEAVMVIRLMDRVVTNVAAVTKLRRDSGPGRILLYLDELSEEESTRFETRLNALSGECGCVMAKFAAVAAAILYLVFLVEGGVRLLGSFWTVGDVGIVFVGLVAVAGRILGTKQADREFQETTTELAGILRGDVPRESDVFAVVAASRMGKAKGFGLQERRV